VLKVVAKVRHWWKPTPLPSARAVPYQVTCPCGTIAQGFRQARHQVVTCAGCGQKVFILPASPLTPVVPRLARVPVATASIARNRNPWRLPFFAAGLTLIVVVLILAAFLSYYLHPSNPTSKPKTLGQHLEAGRDALAKGKFLRAATELEAAQAIRAKHPELLSPAERRELTQLHRQANLLAGLLSESLEEILLHAAELVPPDDQEWQRLFGERYRGKALIFETEVQRVAAGHYQVGYAVWVRGRRAQLDLGDLQMFRALPLQESQRLLFGVRLADIRLEAEGIWVVRVEPSSGVLLTHLEAAAACCSLPAAELEPLVGRQAQWLANLP
jgi:hypothetical protein